MKKIIAMVIVLALVFTAIVVPIAAQPEAPGLVPLRAHFESLGFTVSWNAETSTATVTGDGIVITVTIGDAFIVSNGERFYGNEPPRIVNDRFMVDLVAISSALAALTAGPGLVPPVPFEEPAVIPQAAFNSVTGVVTVVEDFDTGTRYTVDVRGGSTAHFFAGEDTLVISDNEIEVGMTVTGFYDPAMPMPSIYPPFYTLRVLAGEIADYQSVLVDRFEQTTPGAFSFLNQAGNMFVGVTGAEIVFEDGTPFEGELEELNNRILAMVHGIVLTSFPGQTSATKVYILFEQAVHPIHTLTDEELAEMNRPIQEPADWQGGHPLSQEEIDAMWDAMFDPETVQILVNGEAIDAPRPFVDRELGMIMLPVAAIAEALGFDVYPFDADSEDGASGLVIGRSTITVGLDSYAVGRRAPVQLGAAPVIVNDVIFVPMQFFGEVLTAGAYIADGNVVISSVEHDDEYEYID